MNKVLEHLSNAGMEISRAIYYSCGQMETRDEKELRFWVEKIGYMIKRLEGEENERT